MKMNNYTDWVLKLGLPCAIACVVLVCAMMSAINLQDWWLIRLFVVLFVVSFIGLLFSAVRCFIAATAQMATDIEEAHRKGMKTADIVWVFICLAFGVVAMVVCIKLGARVSHSLLIGIFVFLAMAFTPMIISRKKAKKDLTNLKETQQEAEEVSQSKETAIQKRIEYLDNKTEFKDVVFPASFPTALSDYAIKVLFFELAKEQILDKNFQPIIKSKVQLALLADTISSIFDIQNKWQVFEPFWGEKGLKHSLSQANKQALSKTKKSDPHLDYKIYVAFKKASLDQTVGSIRTFNKWVENYEMKYLD